MSETSYGSEVWNAVRNPDAWDAGGTAFTGSQQAFKEFGELLGKLRNGTLGVADAQRLDAVVKYISNGVSGGGDASQLENPPICNAETLSGCLRTESAANRSWRHSA